MATLLIRAEGNTPIGSGHVMRCLALAQAWCARGGKCLFASAGLSPALGQRLASEGFGRVEIPAKAGSNEDAAATVALAREHRATWVVADGYAFDAAWQAAVRAAGCRLLLLDDYGHASHYAADIVLNQNISARAGWYASRAPETRLLLGTRFALLRREFLTERDWSRDIPAVARKILVTLGGGDPDNVTGKVIAALAQLPDIEAVVVAGPVNPNRSRLEAQVATLGGRVRLEVNPPNMPELMKWADLALAAGGSTSWELAFLGLPSVVIVLAENQAEIAAELHRREIAHSLGPHAPLEPAQITATVQALMADPLRRRQMSERGRSGVDGHGAARVAAALGGSLKLTLISDEGSWLNAYLPDLKQGFEASGCAVHWTHQAADVEAGDLAFLLSLSQVVPVQVLRRNAHNLVVHESALPQGRGWSPLTWQVLAGKNQVPVSLLEAQAAVDSGEIYAEEMLQLGGHELVAELRAAQAAATLRLCRRFVADYPFSIAAARAQTGEPSYHARRRAADSRLDPDKTIREQFNLLRVADPDRYPAFFELAGRRYFVRVTAEDPASAGRAEPNQPTKRFDSAGESPNKT